MDESKGNGKEGRGMRKGLAPPTLIPGYPCLLVHLIFQSTYHLTTAQSLFSLPPSITP